MQQARLFVLTPKQRSASAVSEGPAAVLLDRFSTGGRACCCALPRWQREEGKSIHLLLTRMGWVLSSNNYLQSQP
jgi:hypothetical protein